uniref:Uncharacterized protein n=1 Tax=Zea mays TaxID=4577 RepID=A0A804LW22_MAIZE
MEPSRTSPITTEMKHTTWRPPPPRREPRRAPRPRSRSTCFSHSQRSCDAKAGDWASINQMPSQRVAEGGEIMRSCSAAGNPPGRDAGARPNGEPPWGPSQHGALAVRRSP